jgi:hypothetical protein
MISVGFFLNRIKSKVAMAKDKSYSLLKHTANNTTSKITINQGKIEAGRREKNIRQEDFSSKENLKGALPKHDNTALFKIIKKNEKEQISIKAIKKASVVDSEIPLREGNIALILDSYDDIFSDFDPRLYSQRALSDDFLSECRRASRDKQESGLELRFFVPNKKRSLSEEMMIRKRLKSHFEKHYTEKLRNLKDIKTRGFLWVLVGAIALLISTSIEKYQNFFIDFLFIVSQPAGWFLMWSGLEEIFIAPRDKRPELDFYKKMAKAKIVFYSY